MFSKRFVRWLLASALLLASAAFAVAALGPFLRSTRDFLPYQADPRICYQAGAENIAAVVAGALPQAIATIERAQLRPFAAPVRVYVCATERSFERFGFRVKGAGGFVFNGRLFISPKPQNTPERLPGLLTHELSHLHLEQWRGSIRCGIGLPGWFKEGLAVHVSGMGAGNVTEAEAREAITQGRAFRRDATGSVLFPQTGPRDGLPTLLYYRECAMFVDYLAQRDPAAFNRLLGAIEDRASFSVAVNTAYHRNLDGLWSDFVEPVRGGKNTGRP